MFGVIGIIVGILLGAFGLFMVFFFPTASEHQPEEFTIAGIIMGVVCLAASFFLIFY